MARFHAYHGQCTGREIRLQSGADERHGITDKRHGEIYKRTGEEHRQKKEPEAGSVGTDTGCVAGPAARAVRGGDALFNVDITTICLIENIYDYLYNHNYSLTIITYNDNKIAIHSFLYDLLEILESSRIDLTMQELFKVYPQFLISLGF